MSKKKPAVEKKKTEPKPKVSTQVVKPAVETIAPAPEVVNAAIEASARAAVNHIEAVAEAAVSQEPDGISDDALAKLAEGTRFGVKELKACLPDCPSLEFLTGVIAYAAPGTLSLAQAVRLQKKRLEKGRA